MKPSSLLLLVLPGSLALGSAGGCGNDRRTEQQQVTSSGAGGSSSGTGDPSMGDPRANFGRACSRSEDCGVELLCLSADSRSLRVGGPPRGLCTRACDDDPSVCQAFADDARCASFGTRSYCVEACEYGSSLEGAFDAEKCHGRTEFACKPTRFDSDTTCVDESDCDDDERCDSVCYRVKPTCMPQCNGDSDCDSGLFCDPRTGECVSDLPRGRGLAERCNVDTEPDVCRGTCGQIERVEGGRCDESCTLGAYPACGLVSNPPNVGCAIPVVNDAGFGDVGYCAPLCDCTDDCPSSLHCAVATFAYLQRPGYCKSPGENDQVISDCGGSGGGGGAPGVSTITAATSASAETSTSAGGTLNLGGQAGASGAAGESAAGGEAGL
jgi:hypothetical protein